MLQTQPSARRLGPTLALLAVSTAVLVTGCSSSTDNPASGSAGASSSAPTADTSPSAITPSTAKSTGASNTPAASSKPTGAATSSKPTGAATSGKATGAATSSQPSAGSTSATVPSRVQVTNKPTKKLTQATSSVAPQLTAELTSTRSAYVKANNPGEVSGSSVILGVKIDNGTSSGVDLGNVVVNLTQANGSPASSITSAPAKPLSGTLKSGATAAGTYVFVVPSSQRNPITVTVTLSADTKVAVFRGKVA